MKLNGPALREAIRSRARGLEGGPRQGAEAMAQDIARALNVDVALVKGELAALFDDKGSATAATHHSVIGASTDVVPVANKGTGGTGGARALDLLSRTRALSSTKTWDPLSRLPASQQARLSPADQQRIQDVIGALQKQVKEHKLEFVPVFGYLSLRTHNFAELGKKSQADVVMGKDVVEATLPGWDVDVVASSVFRGTPEHPGAVAGLGKKDGASTPGVVLKVPLDRAEELLAVLLARELFAEGDLNDGVNGAGRAVSNAMYAPALESVQIEGRDVPALFFATNDDGAKAVNRQQAFGDDQGLTTERMAYLFAAQGGFVRDGKDFGGPTVDYWQTSYVEARKAAGQPVNPTIAAAVELSKLMPQQEVVDRLLANTDHDSKLMIEALNVLFAGAAVPLGMKRAQKNDDPAMVRKPQGSRGDDATERLLAKARDLERAGKITVT